jgi:hypothetical protein
MCRQAILGMGVVGLIWTFGSVPIASAAQDDEVALMAKARLEVAVKGYECAETVHEMWMWSQRILQSELFLCQSIDNRIAVLENQLRRTEKLERMVLDGHKSGTYTTGEVMEARFYRLDTQCKLAEEKAKKSHGTK